MESMAKIRLSAEEAQLIDNPEWILTKHRVIEKVYKLFGQLHESMKYELGRFTYLPEGIQNHNGKISRGENYQLLPYVILDYPSFFGRNNIFAIRTMFWWGNFFSVTLHLSGDYKKRFINNSPAVVLFLQKNDFFVCVGEEEWQHHFEEINYLPAKGIPDTFFRQAAGRSFFKAAKKLPLKEWESANSFIMNSFKEMLELLQINSLNDKKDPSPGFPIAGSDL